MKKLTYGQTREVLLACERQYLLTPDNEVLLGALVKLRAALPLLQGHQTRRRRRRECETTHNG